jgi:hypothetical protein
MKREKAKKRVKFDKLLRPGIRGHIPKPENLHPMFKPNLPPVPGSFPFPKESIESVQIGLAEFMCDKCRSESLYMPFIYVSKYGSYPEFSEVEKALFPEGLRKHSGETKNKTGLTSGYFHCGTFRLVNLFNKWENPERENNDAKES